MYPKSNKISLIIDCQKDCWPLGIGPKLQNANRPIDFTFRRIMKTENIIFKWLLNKQIKFLVSLKFLKWKRVGPPKGVSAFNCIVVSDIRLGDLYKKVNCRIILYRKVARNKKKFDHHYCYTRNILFPDFLFIYVLFVCWWMFFIVFISIKSFFSDFCSFLRHPFRYFAHLLRDAPHRWEPLM